MDQKILIGFVLIGLLVVGILLGYFSFNKTIKPDGGDVVSFDGGGVIIEEESGTSEGGTILLGSSSSEHEITITDSGYSPSTLTISVGDSVTWTNEGSRSNWPASDVHPTHTVYPDSSIKKCGGSEESQIFDACKGLSVGESYIFTFNEAGTWRYHDHLRASMKGTITVN